MTQLVAALPLLLAQQTDPAVVEPAVVATPPWWHVLIEQAFAVTVLFIFLAAVVALIVNQRRKDKCLKLMHGYDATILDTASQVLWGRTRIYPRGMEVVFDQPYTTRRGIVKRSALIYEAHQANLLALFRFDAGLDPGMQARRRRQVRRTFHPHVFRRMARSIRNVLNTLRDAFAKALSAVIGQLVKSGRAGVVGQQQASVDQIGQTLLGAAGNAYEPLLERQIGRPVVLQLKSPLAGDAPAIDIPGYLADYTDKHVAVFNTAHPMTHEQTLTLTEPIEQPGLSISVEADRVTVKATGPELVVVRAVETDRESGEIDAVLLQGASMRFNHGGTKPPVLRLAMTRRVDVVCPRSLATVLFGSVEGDTPGDADTSRKPQGVAPEHVVESHSDNPAG